MPEENTPLALIVLAQTIVLVAMAVVLRMRVRRDTKVGAPIRVELDSGGFKTALFALELGLLIVAWQAEAFPSGQAVMTLLGTMILTAFTPGRYDSAVGESGVFRGWYGRRYEELEEWRLTGDHLRFRLFGEWTAVEVPRERIGHVRRLLTELAPQAESPFRD